MDKQGEMNKLTVQQVSQVEDVLEMWGFRLMEGVSRWLPHALLGLPPQVEVSAPSLPPQAMERVEGRIHLQCAEHYI